MINSIHRTIYRHDSVHTLCRSHILHFTHYAVHTLCSSHILHFTHFELHCEIRYCVAYIQNNIYYRTELSKEKVMLDVIT